ncbi:hypothetical protein WIA91_06785 [Klebsiella pneumoniae]
MTKSTITREESVQAIFDLKVGYRLEFADIEILKRVARIALAAMDSEPVAYIFKHPAGRLFWSLTDESNKGHDDVMPVYASPQPAPVVPEEKSIPNTLSMYAVDAVAAIAEVKDWNACRAAMLQELKKSAGSEAICRSDENVQVLHTKSPAQSDCCPAQNSVTPAQGGNSLVIPDEMTSGQAYEIGYYYGDPVDVFARGANWMRQHIIDSTLAAAPQSSGSEPATVPGKWIPVSEQKPDCWCLTCRPVTLNDMRFVVCPDCGNKRCPRANDHRNACTGSNEPGQEGSAYPAAPQEVRGE